MTTNISEEELLLRKRARRRLVGAIVLVLVSIIVLPAVFDEPKSSNEKQEIAINLPSANNSKTINHLPKDELVSIESFNDDDPSIEFQNKMKAASQVDDETTELPSDRKHLPIPGIKPKIDRPVVPIRDTVAAIASTPKIDATASAISAVPPIIPTASVDATKGFVIQLGAYSDQTKAKQQQANLITNGFKAYTETHNEVMRVRIGPFTTRAAAENELKKLKKIGLEGVVIPR